MTKLNEHSSFFLDGVLATLNKLYWKIADNSKEDAIACFCSEGSDILTAFGYNHAVQWNEEKEQFEAVEVECEYNDGE